MLFLAFEGFGLITNAAGDMAEPEKTLPRAIFLAIGVTIVVYIAVSLANFGNLSATTVAQKSDYALAAAAEPALGHAGFILMAVAALFSTDSAINATQFGGAGVSYQVARDRELPKVLLKNVWLGGKAGLFVTAALVSVLAALVPLGPIANTGSAAFLVIYGAVCVAHFRLRKTVGGHAIFIVLAIAGYAGVLGLLLTYLVRNDLASLGGFGGLLLASLAVEWAFRRAHGPIRSGGEGVKNSAKMDKSGG